VLVTTPRPGPEPLMGRPQAASRPRGRPRHTPIDRFFDDVRVLSALAIYHHDHPTGTLGSVYKDAAQGRVPDLAPTSEKRTRVIRERNNELWGVLKDSPGKTGALHRMANANPSPVFLLKLHRAFPAKQ